MRHRGVAATHARSRSSLALLIPATNLHLGNADPDTIAKAGPAKQGLDLLASSGIGKGAIVPTETLVPAGRRAARSRRPRPTSRTSTARSRRRARDWRRDGLAVVVAVPLEGDESSAGRDTVQNLIDAAHGASADARVGGPGPLNADFIDAVYGSFPLMIALIAVLTFILLARAFRSLLLPLKAVDAERAVDRRRVGHHDAGLAGGPRLRARSGGSRRPDRSRRGSR